jgi:ATP-dependent DNA helicase RecG
MKSDSIKSDLMKSDLSIFNDIEECIGWYKKRTALFRKLFGGRIIDALLHMPASVVLRTYSCPPSRDDIGKIVTTKVKISGLEKRPKKSRRPTVIFGCSCNEELEILLFNYGSVKNIFTPGTEVTISGKLSESSFSKVLQFINPEKISGSKGEYCGFSNIYPLVTGVTQNSVRPVINNAIEYLKKVDVEDWLPESIRDQYKFPDFARALEDIHIPKCICTTQLETGARQRLCFDELLAEQIIMRLSNTTNKLGIPIKNNKELVNKLLAKLPFALTNSQNNAVGEIFQDMESGNPMARLLQGDVGSGKTIVATLSALNAIGSDYQCAIMAPTEILAQQHFKTISEYIHELEVPDEFLYVGLLTGGEKGKRRNELCNNIASGVTKILIGTHAIISDQVVFQNLGLVIIDEQHRFGVEQRLRLIDKGRSPHVLSMTATPIPRTMILSLYGDISVSSITEKPYGRKEIITRAMQINKLDEVVAGLTGVIANDHKIYWICPLIEESSKTDYTCVINRLAFLKIHFGEDAQMLHGRMKSKEKDEIFRNFKNGTFHILVSTTVIEVGVDVPDATVIIIENAEKFGLAQLHQLRGRVGRSSLQSFCILLFDNNITKVAAERIEVMRTSNDGFYIAEKDLSLRGGGEIFGTKQSGIKKYRTFDINDPDSQGEIYRLLRGASDLATRIVQVNKHEEYSLLLQIFASKNYKNARRSF